MSNGALCASLWLKIPNTASLYSALPGSLPGFIFAMDILDEIYFAMLKVVLQCAMGLARVMTGLGLRRDAYRITIWVIEECKKVR